MNKLAFVLSFLLMLPVSAALADTSVTASGSAVVTQNDSEADGVSVQAGLTAGHQDDNASTSSSIKEKAGDNRQTKGSEDVNATSSDENASTTEDNGSSVSEEHRSAVASLVHSLLNAAERDGGIGAEVRAVAQSQEESASTTAEAMTKVEARNPFLSFLIGTDWKSVGALRSQIAKTSDDAARLQAAIAKTSDATVKADLEAQLTALQAEQAKVQTFVDAHEHSFSLFGWFTKLFVGANATGTASTTTP